MTFVNVKTLIVLMLFLEQARSRLHTWSLRATLCHVGDPEFWKKHTTWRSTSRNRRRLTARDASRASSRFPISSSIFFLSICNTRSSSECDDNHDSNSVFVESSGTFVKRAALNRILLLLYRAHCVSYHNPGRRTIWRKLKCQARHFHSVRTTLLSRQ